MGSGRLRRRVVLSVLALFLLPPAAFLAWDLWTSNFGTLAPGSVYRSGQMPANVLARTIRERRIKTVLNLRGVNAGQSWYRAERDAVTGSGATLVDISMSSCQWMSRAQLRAVVRTLDTCEYPLLIHCAWGSERTGLVSAFATLLRPGGTLEEAERQFSLRYLFVRAGDGKVMPEHLDQYEAWLEQKEWSHTPDRFRLWAAEGFRPLRPSREQWPYDPYPLVAVTRPRPPTTPGSKAMTGATPVDKSQANPSIKY
jgi:protein tyrosine phosphatase (PTP) superfamily phosphohydrolase (DUF442 family)